MPAGCKGCSHYRPLSGAGHEKYCNYILDTGKSRGCPANNCIHHTKYHKEEDPMPKAISQDKIDEIRAMREQGISVEEIEKLTGVSHNSISKYTKGMKNPAAVAATTGTEESVHYEKLSDDIISSSYGNVKPLEEPTETPSESEDKSDVKTYEDSPETSVDEGTAGTVEKSVPPAVVEACLARIEHLSSEIGKEMVVIRNWEQEIKELREFLGLEEWD